MTSAASVVPMVRSKDPEVRDRVVASHVALVTSARLQAELAAIQEELEARASLGDPSRKKPKWERPTKPSS